MHTAIVCAGAVAFVRSADAWPLTCSIRGKLGQVCVLSPRKAMSTRADGSVHLPD